MFGAGRSRGRGYRHLHVVRDLPLIPSSARDFVVNC